MKYLLYFKKFENLTDSQKQSDFNKKLDELEDKKERLKKKLQYSEEIRDPEKTEEIRKLKKEEIEKNKKS
jgi:hypothetical protein